MNALSGAETLVIHAALDALDRCLSCWILGKELPDDEGHMFAAALMAANRILRPATVDEECTRP